MKRLSASKEEIELFRRAAKYELHRRDMVHAAKRAKEARGSLMRLLRLSVDGYVASAVHRDLCARLEDVSASVDAGESRRVLVEMPPQHGKTEIIGVHWPIWHAQRYGIELAYGTYSQERAHDVSRKARRVAERMAAHWPEMRPDERDRDTLSAWEVDGGIFRYVGRGGPLSGRPVSVGVIDDPYKGMREADSPKIRAQVRSWLRSEMLTRARPASAIVILHTRWSREDIIGELALEAERGGPQWERWTYRAIAEDDDLLGRDPGEALFPERRSVDWLATQRALVGERSWAAMYQQRPVPADGSLFRRPWFGHRFGFDAQRPPHRWERIGLSVDAAFKGSDTSDYCALGIVGLHEGRLYVLHVLRERMAYPELERAAMDLCQAWRVDEVLIEDKANGPALISSLTRALRRRVVGTGQMAPAVRAFSPRDSKAARAQAAAIQWEAGNILLPEAAAWVDEFIVEHLGFGAGAAHDDQVDMISQVVISWMSADAVDPMERAERLARLFR